MDAAKRTNSANDIAFDLRRICEGKQLRPTRETLLEAADEIERLRGPHYVCSHDGYHPGNRARWCALGCGSDYNRMHKVEL